MSGARLGARAGARAQNHGARVKGIAMSATAATDASIDRRVPVSEVDHLSVDPPVTGQAFACVSFVSPDDVLPIKQGFFLERFLRDVFAQRVETFADAVCESPDSARAFANALIGDVANISQDFKSYAGREAAALEAEFAALNPLRLTASGFKVRGCCADLDTARARAEALRRDDPTTDVFVAQVGAWCPVNPSAESVGDAVYDETELNTLMAMRKQQDNARAAAFTESTAERIRETRRQGQLGGAAQASSSARAGQAGDADTP